MNALAEQTSPAGIYISAQLELFEIRCLEMANKVKAGILPLHVAVDFMYSAAVWSDLVDNVGDDVCQNIMGRAFLFSDMGVSPCRG
jgi:hypothetical protein